MALMILMEQMTVKELVTNNCMAMAHFCSTYLLNNKPPWVVLRLSEHAIHHRFRSLRKHHFWNCIHPSRPPLLLFQELIQPNSKLHTWCMHFYLPQLFQSILNVMRCQHSYLRRCMHLLVCLQSRLLLHYLQSTNTNYRHSDRHSFLWIWKNSMRSSYQYHYNCWYQCTNLCKLYSGLMDLWTNLSTPVVQSKK